MANELISGPKSLTIEVVCPSWLFGVDVVNIVFAPACMLRSTIHVVLPRLHTRNKLGRPFFYKSRDLVSSQPKVAKYSYFLPKVTPRLTAHKTASSISNFRAKVYYYTRANH